MKSDIMKIKIFAKTTDDIKELEEAVNSFIKDKKVIDIKFSTNLWKDVRIEEGEGGHDGKILKYDDDVVLHVLVTYEEKTEQPKILADTAKGLFQK